jgi:hypothetical protein
MTRMERVEDLVKSFYRSRSLGGSVLSFWDEIRDGMVASRDVLVVVGRILEGLLPSSQVYL